MPLSAATAAFLRSRGHDATHLSEQGLQRMTDAEIFEKARLEDRIIVTMDLGFGHLLAFAQAQRPSVILFRVEDGRPERIHRLLAERLDAISADLQAGAIVVFEDRDLRIHRLPIG